MSSKRLISIGAHLKVKADVLHSFVGQQNYTIINFIDGKSIMVATSIGVLEDRLKSYSFFRTHKQFIVNLNEVEQLEFIENYAQIKMKSKQTFRVARRRTADLIHLLLNENLPIKINS